MITIHSSSLPSNFAKAGYRARPTIEVDERTQRSYSITRALRVAAGVERVNGPEREISDAYMRMFADVPRSVVPVGDFAIPTWALWPSSLQASGIDTSTAGGHGSSLLITRPGTFSGPLRPRSIALELGATFLDTGFPFALIEQTTAPDAEWVGENTGSDAADVTDLTLGLVPFNVHTLTAGTAVSRLLLTQSRTSTPVDEVIARDLRGRFGTALDRAAIYSTDANGPTGGILNNINTQILPIGTNGGVPTYDHITALEELVSLADGDSGSLGFATTPSIRRLLRKTQRSAGTGDGFVWDRGGMLDQSAAVSRVVPSTLTKGTSIGDCHALVYGDWSSLVVATAEAMTIVVDPFAKKKQGMVEMQAFLFCDLGLQQPKKFAAIIDATLA